MLAFSENQFRKEILPILRKIFAYEDPYIQPFATRVAERRLLYPVTSILTRRNEEFRKIVDTVISAAEEIGDTECYLSILGRPQAENQEQPFHWRFQVAEIKKYRDLALREKGPLDYVYSFEHVLYSARSNWGIMISEEQHGLLGGSSAFFHSMHKTLPGFDDISQVYEFLDVWKYYATKRGTDVSWVPQLLANIYGEQLMQKLLSETSFNEVL